MGITERIYFNLLVSAIFYYVGVVDNIYCKETLMPHFEIHGLRWKLVYLWIILFTILTFYGLHQGRINASHNHEFALQNRALAIQTKKLVIRTHTLSLKGVQAHVALCSLRDGLQKQINNTKAFLLTHPNGVPGLVTRSAIVASLSTQQATTDTLDILKCK